MARNGAAPSHGRGKQGGRGQKTGASRPAREAPKGIAPKPSGREVKVARDAPAFKPGDFGVGRA